MKIPIYQVDAFTDRLFAGNPAAVCPLEDWLAPEIMQNIAAENNLSETAFFVKKDRIFELRWFTPATEVDLCGHATLASGHVLYSHLGYTEDRIAFSTMSGEVGVTRSDGRLVLDFPATPPSPAEIKEELIRGLGREPKEALKSRDYLAVFDNEDEILTLQPDFSVLRKLDCLGIIVTAEGKGSDFVSRFFAPAVGINEDPVTGSAHTTLVPFWSERLKKNSLHAFQLSRRRGELFCQYSGDRVKIGGHAVTFFTGEIIL